MVLFLTTALATGGCCLAALTRQPTKRLLCLPWLMARIKASRPERSAGKLVVAADAILALGIKTIEQFTVWVSGSWESLWAGRIALDEEATSAFAYIRPRAGSLRNDGCRGQKATQLLGHFGSQKRERTLEDSASKWSAKQHFQQDYQCQEQKGTATSAAVVKGGI